MSGIHEVAKELMEAAVGRDEWDEMPMLIILRDDNELGIFPFSGINTLDFMDHVEEGAFDGDIPHGNVKGIALFNEGWGFMNATAEQAEWAQTHSIADHPEGVETKMVVSYDGIGLSGYMLVRGQSVAEKQTEDGFLSGRVPDAVRRVFEALNS